MCDIITGYHWHEDPSKMILRLDNREDPPNPTLSKEDVPFLKDANKGFLTFFKDILYNTQFRETVRKDFEECLKLLVDYFDQDPDDIPKWLW